MERVPLAEFAPLPTAKIIAATAEPSHLTGDLCGKNELGRAGRAYRKHTEQVVAQREPLTCLVKGTLQAVSYL